MSEREALVMEGTLFAQDPDGTPEEKREAPGAPDNELVFEGWGSRRLRDAMRIAMTIVRTRTKVTGCRLVSRRDDRDALVFASDSHRLAQVRISEVSRSTKSAGLDLALPAQAVKALAQGVPGPRVRIRAENGHAVIEHAESDETTVYPTPRRWESRCSTHPDPSPVRTTTVHPARAGIDRRVACWLLYGMLEVRRTEVYAKWLDGLRDVRARARVLVRVERLAAGNPGDVKPVGEGVSEMRIEHGPGYPCTSSGRATRSSCCWPAATSARRRPTSRRPCA